MEQMQYNGSQHSQAMISVCAGKNIFGLLVILAILTQLATFVLLKTKQITIDPVDRAAATTMPAATTAPATMPAETGNPENAPAAPPEPAAAPQPAANDGPTTQPQSETFDVEPAGPVHVVSPYVIELAATEPATEPADKAATTQPSQKTRQPRQPMNCTKILQWVLPTTKFIGFVASILLAVSVLLGVNVAIIGQRQGVDKLVSAFFWSLLLVAMLTPWQQIMPGSFASGALYNLGDLRKYYFTGKETFDQVMLYGRLAVYPGAALLVTLIVLAKFCCGRGRSVKTNKAE